MEENRTAHESYGLLGFTKRNGNIQNLFGSPITHHASISMSLYQAEHIRKLSNDWYGPVNMKPIVEVEMSNAQFVEAITTMNVGFGVPVTIRYLNGKQMEKPPFESERKKAHSDFNRIVSSIDSPARVRQRQEARDLLKSKKALTREERDAIFGILCDDDNLTSNISFVHKSFDEACDKTVSHAKAEIDAMYTGVIHRLGGEALARELTQGAQQPRMLGIEGKEV